MRPYLAMAAVLHVRSEAKRSYCEIGCIFPCPVVTLPDNHILVDTVLSQSRDLFGQ